MASVMKKLLMDLDDARDWCTHQRRLSPTTNEELASHLAGERVIKASKILMLMRTVDRGHFCTNSSLPGADEADLTSVYQNFEWRCGPLNLLAPEVYVRALENLDLQPGQRFLHVGSGSGYLSTLAGLLLGPWGTNIGIEIDPQVAEFSRQKVAEFPSKCPAALEAFDFCTPQILTGNCFDLDPSMQKFDRIFCGSLCSESQTECLCKMLKDDDGLLFLPEPSDKGFELKVLDRYDDEQVITKFYTESDQFDQLLTDHGSTTVMLPETRVLSLMELCRRTVRSHLRACTCPSKFQSVIKRCSKKMWDFATNKLPGDREWGVKDIDKLFLTNCSEAEMEEASESESEASVTPTDEADTEVLHQSVQDGKQGNEEDMDEEDTDEEDTDEEDMDDGGSVLSEEEEGSVISTMTEDADCQSSYEEDDLIYFRRVRKIEFEPLPPFVLLSRIDQLCSVPAPLRSYLKCEVDHV